jgi:hypothetical protein
MPSLEHFLKTGELGPIRIGLTTDEVEREFGPPGDVSVSKRHLIWKYAIFDLLFYTANPLEEPVVESITVNVHSRDASYTNCLAFSDWIPSPCMPIGDFKDVLDRHSIRVVGGVTTGPDQYLVLESTVRATFDEGTLHSIGYAAKNEPKVKQINLSIPKDDFEAVRREAAELGISVSVLCSRWIRERVMSLQPHS